MSSKRLLAAIATLLITLPAYVISESPIPIGMGILVGLLIGTCSDVGENREVSEDVRAEVQALLRDMVSPPDEENQHAAENERSLSL